MKLPEPNLINKYPTPGHYTAEQMLAWGKANAEAEREACAKLCESHVRYPSRLHFADAIRARSS